jgi:hypothetical protein
MNQKSKVTVLLASVLLADEIALQHTDALVPTDHVHVEVNAEPVTRTAVYSAASGNRVALDDGAFMPPLPWQVDQTMMMAAAQRMIRLGDDA